MRKGTQAELESHLSKVRACRLCADMAGPVVVHGPVVSKIYLVGQAPGPREGAFGKPFAWTAGKTLFKWFAEIGASENEIRSRAFIAAVCRCFPGKTHQGGDRVPSAGEVANCARWMRREVELLRPELVIPIGKLAIERALGKCALVEAVGKQHRLPFFEHECDVIPLPHPSGASSWFKVEPGKGLLRKSLELIAGHPAWQELFGPDSRAK